MSPRSGPLLPRCAVSALTLPPLVGKSQSRGAPGPCLALQSPSTVVAFHHRIGLHPKTAIGACSSLTGPPALLTTPRPDLALRITEVPSGESMAWAAFLLSTAVRCPLRLYRAMVLPFDARMFWPL